MIVEIKELTKYYGKTKAIENISFSIQEGEIVGFVGPNGAGKTTTIRILLGLLKPTSGSVQIFGKNVLTEYHTINKDTGYIPGEVNYYQSVKVKDFFSYALSFYENVDYDYFNYLCELLKVELNKKIEDLSLGNKKKLAIVQAFVHKPKLLILDEPTNGLDPFLQKQLYQLIKKEREERKVTVFFSSHNLSEVQKLCDRILFINKGALVQPRKDYSSVKKVRITSDSTINLDLPILNSKEENGTKEFFYTGNLNDLLKKLSELEIEDLSIEDVSLEEIFDELYKE